MTLPKISWFTLIGLSFVTALLLADFYGMKKSIGICEEYNKAVDELHNTGNKGMTLNVSEDISPLFPFIKRSG